MEENYSPLSSSPLLSSTLNFQTGHNWKVRSGHSVNWVLFSSDFAGHKTRFSIANIKISLYLGIGYFNLPNNDLYGPSICLQYFVWAFFF